MSLRGWCPGVHEPMPSGDGLLVRVKPFGGCLPRAALHALATAAEAHGNGAIELTSRGNLQVRGLTEPSAARFAAAMVAAGLADPDPARERRRNVITMPPYDDALAAEVEALLASLPGLAPKFCVALGPAEADIVIQNGRMTAAGRTTPYSPQALRHVAMCAAGARLPPACVAPPPPADDLLHLPFGQTSVAALHRLADATDQARTTPFRAFHVPGGAAVAGFITDPTDPLLRIAACAGAPACRSASTPTRADAALLAALGVTDIHVSGCGKGCARHRPARTLVGRDGRYDLVRHGRAGDPAEATGLTIHQAAALLA